MKALHVFPQFTPHSINGSERYEYQLAAHLVRIGVEVDLLTTTTRDFLPIEPFSLGWPDQYRERESEIDGIRIRRFPAWRVLPLRFSNLLSRQMLKRYRREEQLDGVMLNGSRNLIDYYYRRAIERPRIYDLVTIGRGPYSAGLIGNLVRNIRSYDIVQVGFCPFALTWQVVALARLFRKPVVVLALFHPDDISHHFRSIYWSLSAADAVLTQTPFSTQLLKRLLPRSRPLILGAGIDMSALDDGKSSGARFRAKYGLNNRRIVLFVGRKEFFKRYNLAIEAVDVINQDRVHLVMIGRDIDGHPVASQHATYLGEVNAEDLADAYDACDVFLLPSEAESFGMVFLEAWARRKPVIGNPLCRPVACLIEHGKDGFLCRNVPEIVSALTSLLDDPSLAQRLGRAGYEKVVTRYTWDLLAAKVRDLYLQLAPEGLQLAHVDDKGGG